MPKRRYPVWVLIDPIKDMVRKHRRRRQIARSLKFGR